AERALRRGAARVELGAIGREHAQRSVAGASQKRQHQTRNRQAAPLTADLARAHQAEDREDKAQHHREEQDEAGDGEAVLLLLRRHVAAVSARTGRGTESRLAVLRLLTVLRLLRSAVLRLCLLTRVLLRTVLRVDRRRRERAGLFPALRNRPVTA